MSEKTVQEGIQTILQSMAEFDNDDVTIDDWSILDGAIENAPYSILETADEFYARQDVTSESTTWFIYLTVLVAFDDWDSSRTALRDTRQAIVDKFNEVGNNRSAGGISGVDIQEIRAAGPIAYRYRSYNEYQSDELPLYAQQQLILETVEMAQ